MAPASDQSVIDPARIDAVIFDLDGVLTDTARVHETAWASLFDPLLAELAPEAEPFGADDYRRYVDGRNRTDGIRVFLAARGLELPDTDAGDGWSVATLASRKDAFFAAALEREGLTVFQDAVRLLHRLRDAGVHSAVATASHHRGSILASAGLGALFAAHVDGFDMDALELSGKPAPAIFLEAARRLGVTASRAVVVEDAVAGVQAARAGRFARVIGVARGGEGTSLLAAGASEVVESLDHVRVRRSGA